MNRQIALRPQDLVLMVKLALAGRAPLTFASLSKALFLSASEVHAGLQRCRLARLVAVSERRDVNVNRPLLRDFVLHGARFAFPPVFGSLTRGMPTAHAGPGLREIITQPEEPPPVWPYAKGEARGIALYPLYQTVPKAVEADVKLHEVLSLFDAIRIGNAREREIATAKIRVLLA